MNRFFVISALIFACLFSNNVTAAIPVACGVEGIRDYSQSLPFKDAMLSCRDWRALQANSISDYPHSHLEMQGAGLDGIPFDENGYPEKIPANGKKVLTLMLVGVHEGAYPFGTFTLLFEGTGKILLGWDAAGKASAGQGILTGDEIEITGDGGETKYEFEIPDNNHFDGRYGGGDVSTGILLQIVESSEGDNIRNIRLITPDLDGGTSYVNNYESQPFNPVFLEDTRIFNPIRFMDWAGTNDSPNSSWNKRPKVGTCYAARKNWNLMVLHGNI